MRASRIVLVSSLLISGALAGCSGTSPAPGSTTDAATTAAGTTGTTTTGSSAALPVTHNVEFFDFGFEPNPLAIRPGDTVIFKSNSSRGHELRIHELGKGQATFEKEQTVMNGASMEHTFANVGTFSVFSWHYCTPCQSGDYEAPNTMAMTLTVSGTAAAASTTTAATSAATTSASSPAGNNVEFVDYEFKPKQLSTKAGEKVVWTSKSSKGHDIKIHKAGNGHSTFEKEQTVMNGGTMEHTFTSAGTYHVYSYHYCTPCQSGTYDAPNTMAMTITVT